MEVSRVALLVLTNNKYFSSGDIYEAEIKVKLIETDKPQLTLACNSTGGPATTVTWTRDSTALTQRTETVLNDPVTAQYTHTLTVTERLGGNYTCTVANNKPSSHSSSITVEGKRILV